ncbi:YciI family protein [Pseudomonas sp. ICMP 460]|uniref:YciI family protein n=1 Tax=Pseudomonas sp. ICMP 460 TaxID=1718917 RepID=UPI0021159764|nr:YciI family protein [Pseudomonas sp. ICMP 460]
MNSYLKFTGTLFLFTCLCAPPAYACEPDKSDASYPPLSVGGGFLVFGPVAVLEDEGKSTPEMGIGVSFIDCSTGAIKFIARLPYVADPGVVEDAFVADVAPGNTTIFIIHSAPIRAFTGVSYGSDYFSVMVFHQKGKNFLLDQKLTDYLGSGADVVIHAADNDISIYTYPYKARGAIIDKLKSKSYKRWLSGSPTELTVARKAVIYSSMTVADPTKMYLVKGDKVMQESVSAGWVSILYKTVKGKKIRGWLLCDDVGGC